MRTSLLILMLLGACSPRRPVSAEPSWRDFESKSTVQLEVVDKLLDQGALGKAESMMTQMGAEGIDNPELDYLRGRSLYLQGMHAEAELILAEASDKLRRDPRPPAVLGLLYADTKRTEESIEALRESLDRDDGDADTWNNLGFVLMANQDFDEAVEALRAAVRKDGTVARYRNNLGFALHAAGQPGDAFKVFQTTGSRADAHANMALAWELAGSIDRAREQYTEALASNPDHPPAKEGLARLEAQEESP